MAELVTPPPPKPTALKDMVCVGLRCGTPVDRSRSEGEEAVPVLCGSVPRSG